MPQPEIGEVLAHYADAEWTLNHLGDLTADQEIQVAIAHALLAQVQATTALIETIDSLRKHLTVAPI